MYEKGKLNLLGNLREDVNIMKGFITRIQKEVGSMKEDITSIKQKN